VELAQVLTEYGVEIVSTGSTAATIEAAGISVTPVPAVTNFPECLDGRVKTLHPGIHAGLLADLRNPDHVSQLSDLNIKPFDLVVVNLYPFNETVASGAVIDDCIEQIDIGGPAMIRASAKNFANVAVVVSPASYESVVKAIRDGGTSVQARALLSAQAFSTLQRTTLRLQPGCQRLSHPTTVNSRVGGERLGPAVKYCDTGRIRTRVRLHMSGLATK